MRRSIVLLAFVVSLASCTSTGDGHGSTSANPTLTIVFLEDLSVESSISLVVPAEQGVQLALDEAVSSGIGVRLIGEDTAGDPAKAENIARRLAADHSVVAVIAAPFLTGLGAAPGILRRAGVPVLSLSPEGREMAPPRSRTWFPQVALSSAEAAAIADYVRPLSGGTLCYASDGSALSSRLIDLVAAAVGERAALLIAVPAQGVGSSAFAAVVSKAGCAALFWGGFGPEAAKIRLELDTAGLRDVTLVGADAVKDPAFLSEAGAAGEGTVVACACVDLTTATDFAARRFIQDFQADFGLPPGPYAAEAYDVGTILAGVIRGGASTRAEVLDALRSDRACLAHACGSGGRLVPSFSLAHLFIDEGGRWIPLESARSAS